MRRILGTDKILLGAVLALSLIGCLLVWSATSAQSGAGGTGSGTSGPGVRAIWEALYGIEGEDVDPEKAAIPGTTLPDRLPVFQRNGSILPPALRTSKEQRR